MNKKFKIMIINILFILFSVCIIEFIAIHTFYREKVFHIDKKNLQQSTEFKHFFEPLISKYTQKEYTPYEEFRPAVGTEYNKPAILLLGCSFTYGNSLLLEETFQYKLSLETKRPVYNFGLDAASAKEMLYILRNDELRTELLRNNNNIEYVIFTYITDHIPRLYAPVYRQPSPTFIPIENFTKLEFKEKQSLFYRSYFNFFISRHFAFKKEKFENSFDLIRLYLREIKREVDKHFNNNGKTPKFVVMIYNDYYSYPWKELENDEINVLYAKEITKTNLDDRIYRLPNDHHPNEKAWDIIVPALIKKLNL
ncbi:MAG: hypothetical protein IJY61_04795 [Candidatus Gastranaerophilales bacterium]|nr:hypothetical protein [Candidatus Gastranaerophilales bacterium]